MRVLSSLSLSQELLATPPPYAPSPQPPRPAAAVAAAAVTCAPSLPTAAPSTSSNFRNTKNEEHESLCLLCDAGNCKQRSQPCTLHSILPVIPYLIQRRHFYFIQLCNCPRYAHLSCLVKDGSSVILCSTCHQSYHRRWRVLLSRLLCFLVQFLSLASVVGLIFGLAQLGSALDRLGLGSEAGTKLDGDENWHDQEMQQILDWLQLVHFATGSAGEALLGLVYSLGVCSIVGLERTFEMIEKILYLDLRPLTRIISKPKCMRKVPLYISLTIVGLLLGTYLLFYSWIWACLFHHPCCRILAAKRVRTTATIKA